MLAQVLYVSCSTSCSTLSMKTLSKVLQPRVYAQTQELCSLESQKVLKSFITSGPGLIYAEWAAENESGGGAKNGMFQLQ